MKTNQKALIVTAGDTSHPGLDDLNRALDCGWRVVNMIPMGHSGEHNASDPKFAALVVLEHVETSGIHAMKRAIPEVETLIENN